MKRVRRWFAPGLRVLEIGGGDGFQAGILAEWGCNVVSVDLPDRLRMTVTGFIVHDYDGRNLPFTNGSFDAIYSSNVLEHVADLPPLLAETRRVLKSQGFAVHVLPSAAWRFWTSAGHTLAVVRRLLSPPKPSTLSPAQVVQRRGLWWTLRRAVWAGPHGEYPSAISELYYFSRPRWERVFRESGFTKLETSRNNLFYTGNIIAPSMSLTARQRLARICGSACNIFVMKLTDPLKSST